MDLETTLFAEFIDFQEVYSIFQDFLLVENATKKIPRLSSATNTKATDQVILQLKQKEWHQSL